MEVDIKKDESMKINSNSQIVEQLIINKNNNKNNSTTPQIYSIAKRC